MNKKLAISIGIILILSAYIFLRDVKKSPRFPQLPSWENSADEIIIKKNDSEIKISNKNGKWFINDEAYPADKNSVESIEKKMKNIKITDLISEREFLDKYGLSPQKRISVIVKKKGKLLRDIFIGKKSSTNRHTYVKFAQKPGIYLAAETFDRDLNRSVDDLRDKDIIKISGESISQFEINYKGRHFLFTKKVEEKEPEEGKEDKKDNKKTEPEKIVKWICKGYEKAPLSTQKVNNLISGFNPLRASDYPKIEKKSLTKPLCTVKLKAYEKEIVLNIFKKGDGEKYISTSSEGPYVFTLDRWRVKKFFIENIEELKEKKK